MYCRKERSIRRDEAERKRIQIILNINIIMLTDLFFISGEGVLKMQRYRRTIVISRCSNKLLGAGRQPGRQP